MDIREERPEEAKAIRNLTAEAFAPMPYAEPHDGLIPERLRDTGKLTLSLVALEGDDLVGQVTFSPAEISGEMGGWFALGPIAVRLDRQRQGIGSALVAEGLAQLRSGGASGCVLLGNPAVYGPMGFSNAGGLTYRDVDTKYVQWVSFTASDPVGEITFDRAFDP